MLAHNIYNILNKYRKNPYGLSYDSNFIISKIQKIIASNTPITMVFPACHGKIDNPDLVIDHMPDMSEYLGIALFTKMCAEIEEIYKPGTKMYMIHEGHFYVNTPLIHSDQTMDEYIEMIRTLLRPYPYIHSLTLRDFFAPHHTNQQCRDELMAVYAPTIEEANALIKNDEKFIHMYKIYFERIKNDFHRYYQPDAEFKDYDDYAKFQAIQQLRIWIGFRKLINLFFKDQDYIRLSSVYKEPSVLDQIALNYLPRHHMEMPSFNCVWKNKNSEYNFIKKKEAISMNLKCLNHNGFKYYAE